MDNKILIENISFSYPRSHFHLKIDSFSIYKNEITVLTGKNGCGKTTLLKLCANILQTCDRRLYIMGHNASNWNLGQIGKKIGYLFQDPSRQLFCSSVWDELCFASFIKNEDKENTSKKATELLQLFGLEKLALRSPLHLSRGEQQRLAIATILMNSIDFLFLDEPTTGLDKKNKKILIDTIDILEKKGIGIVIITHDEDLQKYYKNARKVELFDTVLFDTRGEE